MRKSTYKKRLITFSTAIALCISMFATSVSLSGCGILIEEEESTNTPTNSTATMTSGMYYIWHNPSAENIKNDLNGVENETNIFFPVYSGNYTFVGQENSAGMAGDESRIIWAMNDSLDKIPTFYQGDELIYYNTSYMPQSFTFERFEDMGNTFGIAGLTELKSGRYAYYFTDNKVYEKADMGRILKLQEAAESCTFDKISSIQLTSDMLTRGGLITGVEAGKTYNFNIYAGTVEYNADFVADTRAFMSMEEVTCYEYDLPEAEIAIVKIPDYLKTGYYYINGCGLFRYVSEGTNYDETTDFNDPMFIYDESNHLISYPEGYVDEYGNPPTIYDEYGNPITTTTISDGNVANEIEENESVDDFGEDIIENKISIPAEVAKVVFTATYEKRNISNVVAATPSFLIVSPGGGMTTASGKEGIITYELESPEEGTWKAKIIDAKCYYITFEYKMYDAEGNEVVPNNTFDNEVEQITSTEETDATIDTEVAEPADLTEQVDESDVE